MCNLIKFSLVLLVCLAFLAVALAIDEPGEQTDEELTLKLEDPHRNDVLKCINFRFNTEQCSECCKLNNKCPRRQVFNRCGCVTSREGQR